MTENEIRPFQKPKCLALVLCENVIEDKRSHSKSLIGLFSRITGSQMPLVYPRFYVMVSLTGGRGKVPVDITISNVETGRTVLNVSGEAGFRDPLSVTDLVLECLNVPFPAEGIYVVVLSCGGERLLERRVEVSLKTE